MSTPRTPDGRLPSMSAMTGRRQAATNDTRKRAETAGKALRAQVSRKTLAAWQPLETRIDPIAILQSSDPMRLTDLVQIRYGRMLQSPFAFYRGSAAIMVSDLAPTPTTGITVQSCGDCHVANFGGFATPEHDIVFDINDFDETLPAPWEWDVKRLAASFVLAARANGLREAVARETACLCAGSYRTSMRRFSEMHPMDLHYLRFGIDQFLAQVPASLRNRARARVEKRTSKRGLDLAYPKLKREADGTVRIADTPPLIFHPLATMRTEFRQIADDVLASYLESLPEERRVLLERYEYVDAALKVVGIGGVGTRCWIMLLMSSTKDPLFLQFKEAMPSVLEPFAGKSKYAHAGQRVVAGQRIMQAAPDAFLGWTTANGREFYVRQLRDAKVSPLIETFDGAAFAMYARACGWNLARAHAKAGDAATIAAYLGNGYDFDEAIGDFGSSYATQTEQDYEALKVAVRDGRVEAHAE